MADPQQPGREAPNWAAPEEEALLADAAAAAAEQDDSQVAFEDQVVSDIDDGAISVPAGGPVSPAEEAWVLEHPWPGHTNREAIDRERAARGVGTAGGSAPSGPAAEPRRSGPPPTP